MEDTCKISKRAVASYTIFRIIHSVGRVHTHYRIRWCEPVATAVLFAQGRVWRALEGGRGRVRVVLGRDGEAESIARENLELLKAVADQQDSQFLRSTGGSLDILHRKGRFAGPPKEFGTWSSYLNSLSTDDGSGKVKKSESDGF